MIQRNSKGFTLIELMLAMSFVSMLLLAIAALTIQVSNIYTRGVTLKQVNEAGLELSSDLQRSIQSGEVFTVTGEANSNYIKLDDGKAGRLCLGTTSYAWNYNELLDRTTPLVNRYDDGSSDDPIRFVKVFDREKKLCRRDAEGAYPQIARGDATTELLTTGDRNLTLYRLNVFSKVEGLYAITLTIGTGNSNLLRDEECRPPSQIAGDDAYCAVNSFDIVARAGSKEGVGQ